MIADNYHIADQFSLLSKLMDIHGENSFKTKSYSIAAFTIEKLPEQLSTLPEDKIFAIKGIGNTIGGKIMEVLKSGELPILKEFIAKTPPGVIEMLNIKGLGPKKISTVWKEMEIESIGELMYACNENRLLLYKGFGEKTQNNIRETIEFYLRNQGSHLYAEIESYAVAVDKKIKDHFSKNKFELTGEWRRQLEIINQLEWVTDTDAASLKSFFEKNDFTVTHEEAGKIIFKGPENISLCFHIAAEESFFNKLFQSSCSEEFLEAWNKLPNSGSVPHPSEEDIFSSNNIHFIPPYLRENASIIEKAKGNTLPAVIQPGDIKAIIHSHSNWSDGSNTVEEMAKACIEKKYEYLVLSDHSKSAFYANGLTEDRIKEQHRLIDELNQKLAPFKIFKGIECDILNDGNLDYSDNILSTFDLVITSIHSNLKMSEDKAMMRLLRAIENPHTTILGHMTGRLLLSRPGYPVDHKKIVDACAANKVVIELNAHPRRLDIDWRWIDYALEKGVLISIDPDAHTIDGYHDVTYGTLIAQKALLTPDKNLSSFSLKQMEEYLASKKK
ncbi:MAG: DNA polymerase/3'-5' exonuclease PolX [Bacteroidetes bacterium]|nr:DNA polymerase/3'-5' exonuclease PolX [Bacteroidota bacterium]